MDVAKEGIDIWFMGVIRFPECFTGNSTGNQKKEYKKNNKLLAYDIALLILEDIIYDIPPVCLPIISDSFPYHDVYPKLNTSMYSFFKSDDTFEKVQVIDFPMAPTSPDTKHLQGGSSMPSNRFPLKGSSGSPIISKINGKSTLIGILSGAGITDCAKCWDVAMAKDAAKKEDYADCKLDCFRAVSKFSWILMIKILESDWLKIFHRNPAIVVDIIRHMNWLKQYFKMEFTLHEKDGATRFDSYNQEGS